MSTDFDDRREQRITLLEKEVASLRSSLNELESRHAGARPWEPCRSEDVSTVAESLVGREQFAQVQNLTHSIFPGELSVEVQSDPESPCERFIVFNVSALGPMDELVRRQRTWHDEVLRALPEALNHFRLSVMPE